MSKQSISDQLEAAVRDPSLQDTTAALAEVALDVVIEDGIIRDIPILGSFVGLGRVLLTIRDRIFLNKLRCLLLEIEAVPVEQRQKMIESINCSEEFSVKVGEKLLYIVDRCEDRQASTIAGRLFKAFLEGLLEYSDFLRLTSIIGRMQFDDVIDFCRSDWERCLIEEATPFIGSGLIDIDSLNLSVEDQWDHKASGKYAVVGGQVTASISELGRKLRRILGVPAK